MEMKLILTEFEDGNFGGDAVSVVQKSMALQSSGAKVADT